MLSMVLPVMQFASWALTSDTIFFFVAWICSPMCLTQPAAFAISSACTVKALALSCSSSRILLYALPSVSCPV